jgi:hypothetical protein
MAILTYKCPHCLTEKIALQCWKGFDFGNWQTTVHLECPKCHLPSCALLVAPSGAQIHAGNIDQFSGDVLDTNWKVREFWPEPPGPLIPEQLPPEVERIYLQAERNYPVEGNEEAAGTMYRKVLDVGLKKIDPDAKGVLAVRIKKLASANKLTPDIAEWADHVRDLGNDAAHEEAPPTRKELDDLRNFTEMVMRYLFSLPALVAARKPKPAKS